jgi:sugar O-acyltransferase (sialic acid O-acetyltransferase NeuD family)
MDERVAIIGGGGFAKEVVAIFESNKFKIAGIFSPTTIVHDYPCISDSEKHLHSFEDIFDTVFLGIGVATSRDVRKRRKIIDFLINEEFKSPSLISQTAIVSKGVTVGSGSFIAHNAVISVDAVIGDYVIVNTSAIIGHDTIIGDNVTISPSVFIGGDVKIGSDVLLGAGCIIMQGVNIGSGSVIGMGSIIVSDISSNITVLPNVSGAIKIIKG